MKPWFAPQRPVRATEATMDQIVATGAAGGAWGLDPLDDDKGWRPAGTRGREVPYWTAEKARIYSVAAYRSNPMARAIIDTYTAFCVGDSGVSYQCTNADVLAVVDEFWTDPKNDLAARQPLLFQSNLILGESLYELMVGAQSGVVRYSPIDVGRIMGVDLEHGNPLWPARVRLGEGDDNYLTVAQVNDETGLREGQAMYWPSFKTLDTDVRGTPFLMSVLDQLDSFDGVLSNLIDRTALARHVVFDVTVQGGQPEVDQFVAARGGMHAPRSGTVEVHNESVTWDTKYVQTGADEDSVAAGQTLTQVAAGAGLSKTWLADPGDANRATALTMAEPVRRRVGSVQAMWLGRMAELTRFAIDRAVAAKRLPATVEATDPRTGESRQVPASQAVTITGPEVAAADAQLQSTILLNLSTALGGMVEAHILSPEAAKVAARKAWEGFVGIPYTAELDEAVAPGADVSVDDVATDLDDALTEARKRRSKGKVTNPGGNAEFLHEYWTQGEGLAKWVGTAHPFTALLAELRKHIPDKDKATRTAAQWYFDTLGHWPGEGHKAKA